MKITNKHNLPEPVYKLIATEYYDGSKADFSVTQLKDSPRIVQLKKRHWDNLEEDAIDRVWSLFGNIAHNLLEQHATQDNTVAEQRLTWRVRNSEVSGKVDCYHVEPDGSGVITDYKVTSVWNVINKSSVDGWEEQLNLYAYLFRKHGYLVTNLRIVAIMRDWQSSKAGEPNYPNTPIAVIPITVWGEAECEMFIEERVYQHEQAAAKADDELPECTKEETWEKATKYALMKIGRKSAVRLFDTIDELFAYTAMNRINTGDNEMHYIATRLGERTRCMKYCSCNKVCNQYQKYLQEFKDGEND